MKIQLNGQDKLLDSKQSLKECIQQFCNKSEHVIAEVNGEIVKGFHWENTTLKDGDVVELVTFVGGG